MSFVAFGVGLLALVIGIQLFWQAWQQRQQALFAAADDGPATFIEATVVGHKKSLDPNHSDDEDAPPVYLWRHVYEYKGERWDAGDKVAVKTPLGTVVRLPVGAGPALDDQTIASRRRLSVVLVVVGVVLVIVAWFLP
jgi:hypothetical protein